MNESIIEIDIKGGVNFNHFYLLDLETFRSSRNFSGILKWNSNSNITDIELHINDYHTLLKAYVSVSNLVFLLII